MSFAKVQIVGNLGRDPEVRYTPNGTMNVTFTIAASGRRRSNQDQQGGNDQDNTTWFRVTAWGDMAERLTKLVERGYVAKGRMLYVDGQLESRQFQGNDGQMRTSLEVTLADFQFVGGRQDGQGGQGGGNFGGGSFGGGNRGGYQNQNQGQQDSSINDQSFGGDQSYGGSNYGTNYGGGQNQNDDFDAENSNLNDVPF